jgi:H+/Cl- antiporter ClcA
MLSSYPRRDKRALALDGLKWAMLAGVVGVLSGSASALFLVSLDAVTQWRVANPLVVLLLPLAGAVLGYAYWRYGATSSRGNALVIEEIHDNKARVPARMAFFVLIGTLITHLFGGSAGREGTAVQMGASLADSVRRVLGISGNDRRLLLMAGVSAGFASVFGTPMAGFVFAMEVQSVGRVRYEGLLPCLVGALVGDLTTRAWGVGHSHYPALSHLEVDALLLGKVLLAGVVFGLASMAFVLWVEWVKEALAQRVRLPYLRPMAGGAIVVAFALLLQTQDYLGLSLPLIKASVNGESVFAGAFALKLVFTGITLGAGFVGGEVTPLFVVGATLGATLSPFLGVEQGLLASIGFVAVFAGASNTPLACTLMGIELFGGGSALYLLVGCFVAYFVSGHHSIYSTQRLDTPKVLRSFVG